MISIVYSNISFSQTKTKTESIKPTDSDLYIDSKKRTDLGQN